MSDGINYSTIRTPIKKIPYPYIPKWAWPGDNLQGQIDANNNEFVTETSYETNGRETIIKYIPKSEFTWLNGTNTEYTLSCISAVLSTQPTFSIPISGIQSSSETAFSLINSSDYVRVKDENGNDTLTYKPFIGNYIFTFYTNQIWQNGLNYEYKVGCSVYPLYQTIGNADVNTKTYNRSEQELFRYNTNYDWLIYYKNTQIEAGNYLFYLICNNDYDDTFRMIKYIQTVTTRLLMRGAISRSIIKKEYIKSNPTYTGNIVSPTFGFTRDSSYEFISGTKSAIDVGKYTLRVSLADNYRWFEDNTTDDLILTWEVKPAKISSKPVLGKTVYKYNKGSIILPIIRFWDQNTMKMSGDLYGTTPKDYFTIIEPDDNHTWNDGTREPIVLQWSVYSDEVEPGHITADVTWATLANNAANGTASQLYEIGSFKYFRIPDVDLTELCDYLTHTSGVLFKDTRDNTVVRSMVAYNKIGGVYKATIIGIDHNSELEGSNRIHWGVFFNDKNELTAIPVLSRPYIDKNTTFYFKDRFTEGDGLTGSYSASNASTLGRWGTDLKYYSSSTYTNERYLMTSYNFCFPLLYQILPNDLKSTILLQRKYFHFANSTTTEAANIISTETYIWPLDIVEIRGSASLTSPTTNASYGSRNVITYTADYEKQYQYFINGNIPSNYIMNSEGKTYAIYATSRSSSKYSTGVRTYSIHLSTKVEAGTTYVGYNTTNLNMNSAHFPCFTTGKSS